MNTCLYSYKEFNIYKSEKIENLYKIELKHPIQKTNLPLLTSLIKSKLLQGVSINYLKNEISFQATSVIPLNELIKNTNITYEKTQEFILSITKQLKHLHNENYSFYGFDLESIIVINNNIFLQFSLEYLVSLNQSTSQIAINQPFSKKNNFFISPELHLQTTLPIFISYKCIYNSLGQICIFLLFKKIIQNIEIISLLKPIEGTKLYWFLLRAIENQIILYI
jgi:hypothetical protein